jgi:hypothetical protein
MEPQKIEARKIKQQQFSVGAILKRLDDAPDQCAVIIGWDDWLRPLVLSISLSPTSATPHLQILPFDKYQAEIEGGVVQALAENESLSKQRLSPEVLWPRVQALIKGSVNGLQDLSSEAIARFVVCGERLENKPSNHHRMAA